MNSIFSTRAAWKEFFTGGPMPLLWVALVSAGIVGGPNKAPKAQVDQRPVGVNLAVPAQTNSTPIYQAPATTNK